MIQFSIQCTQHCDAAVITDTTCIARQSLGGGGGQFGELKRSDLVLENGNRIRTKKCTLQMNEN